MTTSVPTLRVRIQNTPRERELDGVIYEEVHGPPVLPPRYKVNAESPRRGRLCITSGDRAHVSTGALLGDRTRICELEVRARLLEIAHDCLVHTGVARTGGPAAGRQYPDEHAEHTTVLH